MKSFKQIAIVGAITIALGTLAGCGSTSPTAATSGKVSKGMITGFGSVFVNGVEYDTTSASVTAKGASSSESNLQVGQVVSLVGTVDANGTTGTAQSIAYNDDVEGIVSANTVATDNQLVVMGQTVTVDAKTRFKSSTAGHASPADISVNNIVEVSGYSSGTGQIYATRIEEKGAYVAGNTIELKGVVAGLNATAHTFTIGALTVDYSASASVPSALADGLYVEVKATTAPNPNLSATEVKVEDDGKIGEQGEMDDEVELNGVITSINGATSFTLNGQTIGLTSSTEYNNNMTLSTGLNVKVEAKFDANGNPVAKKIETIAGSKEPELKAQGAISTIATDLTNMTVGGVQYYVNNMTVYEDESLAANRYLRINNLATNDNVKLEYYYDNTLQKNVVIALERY